MLLQNNEVGYLASMVAQTGQNMTEVLTTIARENYEAQKASTAALNSYVSQ